MNRKIKLKWWQLALVAVAVSALGSLSGLQSSKRQRRTYKKLKQAPWAPPGWVFAPAWTLNNYFLLSALVKLLNARSSSDRNTLLTLQSMIWLVFFTFNYAYFKKKSPLLAAGLTVTDAGLAVSSLAVASRYNRNIASDYIPLSVWTSFATTLAVYQALYNGDPVFATKAPIRPPSLFRRLKQLI